MPLSIRHAFEYSSCLRVFVMSVGKNGMRIIASIKLKEIHL